MDDELVLYTVTDIMKIFKIGKNKAYDLCKVKGFPTIKIGCKTLIPKEQLKKWISENQDCEIFLS